MHEPTLISFRIERRTLTLCRFRGIVLEYAQRRELASDVAEAETGAETFFNWALQRFSPSGIAIEVEDRCTARRETLLRILTRVASEHGTPIERVSLQTVLAAYGEPPLRSRAELRRIVCGLWPVLMHHGLGRGAFDAAALGLLVQIRATLSALEGHGDAH